MISDWGAERLNGNASRDGAKRLHHLGWVGSVEVVRYGDGEAGNRVVVYYERRRNAQFPVVGAVVPATL